MSINYDKSLTGRSKVFEQISVIAREENSDGLALLSEKISIFMTQFHLFQTALIKDLEHIYCIFSRLVVLLSISLFAIGFKQVQFRVRQSSHIKSTWRRIKSL